MNKKNILTYEGLKKLEDELQDLKVVKRKDRAARHRGGADGRRGSVVAKATVNSPSRLRFSVVR